MELFLNTETVICGEGNTTITVISDREELEFMIRHYLEYSINYVDNLCGKLDGKGREQCIRQLAQSQVVALQYMHMDTIRDILGMHHFDSVESTTESGG